MPAALLGSFEMPSKYRQVVRAYVKDEIGSLPLQRLSGRALSGLYRRMERKGLSASTVKVTHAVLRRALGAAVREGLLTRNPGESPTPRRPLVPAPAPGRPRNST
jgi:site-specific recombinase XerC